MKPPAPVTHMVSPETDGIVNFPATAVVVGFDEILAVSREKAKVVLGRKKEQT